MDLAEWLLSRRQTSSNTATYSILPHRSAMDIKTTIDELLYLQGARRKLLIISLQYK
jgi:hypothetical protein